MATDLTTPSNTLAKCRWHEQYVSEGINKKLNGIIPSGVVRGGRLIASLVNMTVTIQADLNTNDSIYSYIDANGHQVTFRQVGDVSLDLTGVASTTIFIGLEVTYAISADTVVKWRAFSQAEIDADSSLVILGMVVVPASGLIPASDITPEERREAWMSISPATREWRQVVTNGSFELCMNVPYLSGGDEWIGWDLIESSVTGVNLSVTNTEARSGRHSLRANLTGVSTQSVSLYQGGGFNVYPGQKFKASVHVKGSSLTSVPSSRLGILLVFYTEAGGISVENIGDLSLSGTFDWTEISFIGEAHAGCVFARICIRYYDTNNTTGDIYFDDLRLWLEKGDPLDQYEQNNLGEGSQRGTSIDVLPPWDLVPKENIETIIRLRQDPAISSVLQLLMGSRDGTSEFLMQLEKGGIKIDNLINSLGGEKMGLGDDAELPRITTPFNIDASVKYTNLWSMPSPSGKSSIRLYVGDDTVLTSTSQTVFCIVTGASWDASAARWVRDISSNFCQMFMFCRLGLRIYTRNASATSVWPDADWNDGIDSVESIVLDANDDDGVIILADGVLEMDPAPLAGNTNPLTNYAFTTNMLFGKSMVKSWGFIRCTSVVAPNIEGGFNIVSTTYPTNSKIRVNFANPIATTGEYAVVASTDSGIIGSYILVVDPASGFFEIEVFDDAGAPVDVKNTFDPWIYFIAMGEQVV